jgi:copper chaperone CopZ
MTQTIKIDGMTCQHCLKTVREALTSVKGVVQAEVSLEEKKAVVTHEDTLDPKAAIQAVEQEGFKASL